MGTDVPRIRVRVRVRVRVRARVTVRVRVRVRVRVGNLRGTRVPLSFSRESVLPSSIPMAADE
jgi:hypothetical protein